MWDILSGMFFLGKYGKIGCFFPGGHGRIREIQQVAAAGLGSIEIKRQDCGCRTQ